MSRGSEITRYLMGFLHFVHVTMVAKIVAKGEGEVREELGDGKMYFRKR